MTAILWTLTDLATVRLAYQYGIIKDYDEFRQRYAEMRNASTVSVPNSSDGGNGDRRVSDLDDVGVSDD